MPKAMQAMARWLKGAGHLDFAFYSTRRQRSC